VAPIERRAEAVWEGSLTEGSGSASGTSSGAFASLPVTWGSRVERADDRTSPEELLATAHAACYAMALSNVLAERGAPPTRLRVSALVSAELGGDGLRVVSSELHVAGSVPGIDEAAFAEAAEEGERGCPISNALRGNVDIRVQASLDS
jgi:osmotically inducible protein OsmC